MKKFQKILSLVLMGTLLFSLSGSTLAKTSKKTVNQKLQQVEKQKEKWLTLSKSSKNLTEAQRNRIIEKLEKIRKRELSLEVKQKMLKHQNKRKSLRKKIKEGGLTKIEKKSLRVQLKEQKKLLKEINNQLKIDIKSQARRSLSGKELKIIEDVEPNILMELQDFEEPNDPQYFRQWGIGSINVRAMFNTRPETTDDKIVAIIDAGVDFSHEDLAGVEWTSEDCVDENNEPIEGGCMKGGWDFLDHDDDPFPSDNISHGTSVAGVIGAVTNNAIGISSNGQGLTANSLKVMSLRSCCTAEGYFPTQGAAEAVRFAVNNGASVINASFGGPTPSAELEDALAYARDHNVMVVTAAGNYSSDNDLEPFYPANYNLENIISVAAHDVAGNLSWFSNFGTETVDITAPGQDVLSLLLGNNYGVMSGTSFSAPFVSSVLSSGFDMADLFSQLEVNLSLLGKVKNGLMLRFPSVQEEIEEPEDDSVDLQDDDVNNDGDEDSIDDEEDDTSEEIIDNTIEETEMIFISDDEATYSGKWKIRKKKGYEGGSYHRSKTKKHNPSSSKSKNNAELRRDKKKEAPKAVWDLSSKEEIKDKKVSVNVSWVAHSNSSDRAKYTVYHADGETEVIVNQQKTLEEYEESDLQHVSIDKQKEVIKRIRERIKKIREKIKNKRSKKWSGWYELGEFEGVTEIRLENDESKEQNGEIQAFDQEIQKHGRDLKKERNRSKKRALRKKIRKLRKKVRVLRAKLKKIKKRHSSRGIFLTADDLMIEILGDGEDPTDPNPGEEILSEEMVTYTGNWLVEENEEAQGGTSLVYTGVQAGETLELDLGSLLLGDPSSLRQEVLPSYDATRRSIQSLQTIDDWSGELTLFVSWTTGDDRAEAVPYRLMHAGGVYDFTINQRLRADQETVGAKNQWSGWYEVGNFVLNENSKLILTTVDNSDGLHKIVVDEFRLIEPVVTPPDDPVCGNGEVELGEMCDDGNTEDGDGCSAVCVIENAGGDTPVIPIGEGRMTFHHSDHLTGASVDTDEVGLVVNLIDYYPFGSTRLEENPSPQPSPPGEGAYSNDYKFTGKELDSETGLYYYGARYYDPVLSRFVSRDTWEGEMGDPQSMNRYSYVVNNPLKYVDPSGNEMLDIIIEIPSANDPDKLGGKGLSGHTGIGLSGDFQDYGPVGKKSAIFEGNSAATTLANKSYVYGGYIVGVRGGPWWDTATSYTSMGDAIDVALSYGNPIYAVSVEVTPDQFRKVQDYWKNLYESDTSYSLLGKQCTSTVDRSLISAGLLESSGFNLKERYNRLKPEGFLNHVRGNLKNTYGQNKGKLASVNRIYRSKSEFREANEDSDSDYSKED